jgi:hypothetical protein
MVTTYGDANPTGSGGWAQLQLYRGTTALGAIVQTEGSAGNENNPYGMSYIDNPGAGTWTYFLKANQVSGSNFQFGEVSGPVITAFEINGPGSSGISGLSGVSGLSGTSGLSGLSNTGLTQSNYVVQGYSSTSQTIPSNVDTVIQFLDDFDPQNWWDSSNYRFQPTIAGYYNVTLQVLINAGTVTNNQYNTQIRKNGSSQEAIWQNQITTSVGLTQGNSKIIYFNGTTDYVDFTIYNGNPGSVTIIGSSQKSQTFFHASLIVSGGISGNSGLSGISGNSGLSGISGNSGLSGISGLSSQLYRVVNTADSSTITGSTALTLVYSQLIPANTFAVGDIVRISYRGLKTGTAGNNSQTFHINTTNTVSGASLLGTFATTALVRIMQIDRKLYIKNVTTNTETYTNNTNSPYEYTNNPTIVFSNIAINWTVDQYLICSNTLSNSGDSFKGTSFEIERIRTT